MLSKQQRKAEIARLKVETRALELGAICSGLSVEGTRYDCILDVEGKLYRAQIKYCDCRAERCYTKEEVDVLLVYIPSIDKVCFFPQSVFCGKSALHIRLEPSRNGQLKGCIKTQDYLW